MHVRSDLPQLPEPDTAEAEPRRVGVEIEFSGPALGATAEALAERFNGRISSLSAAEVVVAGTPFGDLRLEVDFALLKDLALQATERDERLLDWSVDMLSAASRLVVPLELVTNPLSLSQLADFHAVVECLRALGARGTGDSAVYAFGMHLNITTPDLTAATLLRYIRAFACLFEWLAEAERVDITRRLLPFVQPFPHDYERVVLAADYQPDAERLVEDYLHYNPTRNRALDMLPIFALRFPELIAQRLGDDRIKARPAFHYRLANCSIEQPEWSVTESWERWLVVEHLAADAQRLARWSAERLQDISRIMSGWDGRWRDRVDRWLADR